MGYAVLAISAYLAGSIPFGFLIAKWVAGVDLRAAGSGNIGATNCGRVVGKKWGLVVLAFDALKGLIPTAFFPAICLSAGELSTGNVGQMGSTNAAMLAGTSAILGHVFPVWLGFKGGKGVATALGVLAIVAPWGVLVALAVFGFVFLKTQTISLASILASVAFSLFQLTAVVPPLWRNQQIPLGLFSVGVPMLVIALHRSNIARLLAGTEPTLSTKVGPTESRSWPIDSITTTAGEQSRDQ